MAAWYRALRWYLRRWRPWRRSTTPLGNTKIGYGSSFAGDVVEADLAEKHKKMKEGAFVFLRATYWRWAETILDICPDLATGPQVLGVGDIHLENYGTWRDADGRLVWGVNDFDEAAEMPYALDLARLATSAILAGGPSANADDIASAIVKGYSRGSMRRAP